MPQKFEGWTREQVIEQFQRTIEGDAARREELERKLKERDEEIARLKSMIGIDPLTKALNRYLIGEALEEEVAFCRRMDIPLSLLFIDIDNFKRVNDDAERGGHLAGDAVLVELVGRLRNTLRRYDPIGRYGGEEFLVILKGVTCENARIVAERLRRAIAEKPFKYLDHEIEVTVSIGVAERKNQEMAFSLIGAADRAMLQAKRAGRNRVVADGHA